MPPLIEPRREVKRRLCQVVDPREWASFVEQLEKDIESLDDVEARARAYRQLGEACEEVLARPDRAVAAYQAAFKLDRRDFASLEGARRVHRELGNLAVVAKLYELELKAARPPSIEGRGNPPESADRGRL